MSLTSCLFVAGTLPRELISRDLIHLIDDIFWNLGFNLNDETQAEKVIVIIHTISQVLSLISIITIIPIIPIIPITNSINYIAGSYRTRNPQSRLAGKDWVLSSSLNCVWHGWHTSARPIPMGRLRKLTAWVHGRGLVGDR
jgi:hypothetical protein